jgi:transposase
MEQAYYVAGIDVHKKMLAVVVANARDTDLRFEGERFGTTSNELCRWAAWLQERAVREVVMESTAQYGKPVWLALEGQYRLHLAQARSNQGPRGRKTDFRDAQRLVSRLLCGELVLSYVPEAEQRHWRTLARTKQQLVRDKVRLQSQLENLLEEAQIKLSSVLSDLLGVSGRRILRALAEGETDARRLAELADGRLHVSQADLMDALRATPHAVHRQVLTLYLARLELLESQMAVLDSSLAQALEEHQEAVLRWAEVPGLGIDSAQQILAEIGPQAAAFPSAGQFASWVGICPGRQESAGESHNNRSPKGNRALRRLLNQAAHAAVKKNGSSFQRLLRRWLPRLGYKKAIGAIAHRLCRLVWKILHERVRYDEQGMASTPKAIQRRRHYLVAQLRRLGYQVELTPLAPVSVN